MVEVKYTKTDLIILLLFGYAAIQHGARYHTLCFKDTLGPTKSVLIFHVNLHVKGYFGPQLPVSVQIM